jgi:hypothetical protein
MDLAKIQAHGAYLKSAEREAYARLGRSFHNVKKNDKDGPPTEVVVEPVQVHCESKAEAEALKKALDVAIGAALKPFLDRYRAEIKKAAE